MSKSKANTLKNSYIDSLRGPGAAAAVLGAGTLAAIGADKLINSEANHAAKMVDVVQNAYESDPKLAQAVSYIYGGTTSNIAPVHIQSVGELLSQRGNSLDAEILEYDHPGMVNRIEQLTQAEPELAAKVGMIETLHAGAIVKGLAGGHGIEEVYEASPANSAIPLVGGLAAGGGVAAGINRFMNRG